MKVPLIIDYCTLNVPKDSFNVSSLSDYIAGENLSFKAVGKSETPNIYKSPFGIDFQVNGGYNKEQVLRFSGKGCENFPYSINRLQTEYKARVSRLDITFDADMSMPEWRNYLTSVFQSYMLSDRKSKVYNLITGNEKDAATVNIGARRSPFFFRIYNKTLEQHEEPVDDKYIIRFECELKRFTRTRAEVKEIYDPTYQYQLYWNDLNALSELVKGYWESYAPQTALPFCWDEIEFCYPDTIKILLDTKEQTVKEHIQREYALKNIKDFKATLTYVVSHFGRYIPFIVDDDILLKECIDKCADKHGMRFIIEKQVYLDYEGDSWEDVVAQYDYSKDQMKI